MHQAVHEGTKTDELDAPDWRGARRVKAEAEVSVADVITGLKRHRLLLLLPPVAALLLTFAVASLSPPKYMATAMFMPQASEPPTGGGTLASFGIGGSSPGQSPAFYAQLVTTRELLLDAVRTSYEVETDSGSVSTDLATLWNEEELPPNGAVKAALGQLEKAVEVSPTGTGIIEIRVTTDHPELSEQIATKLLELVNDFNVRRRQTAARAEREFLEQRLSDSRSDLRSAEEMLQRFLQNNRNYQNSPEQTFQVERLQREVDHRAQLYTHLATSFEQARLDEVKNIPLITIIEHAEDSATATRDSPVFRALFAAVFFAMIAIVVALYLEFGRKRPHA